MAATEPHRIVDYTDPPEIERGPKRMTESGSEGVHARGRASDNYVESIERGYEGFVVEDIDDEAFTLAGVVADPTVADKSGKAVGPDIETLSRERNQRTSKKSRKR